MGTNVLFLKYTTEHIKLFKEHFYCTMWIWCLPFLDSIKLLSICWY